MGCVRVLHGGHGSANLPMVGAWLRVDAVLLISRCGWGLQRTATMWDARRKSRLPVLAVSGRDGLMRTSCGLFFGLVALVSSCGRSAEPEPAKAGCEEQPVLLALGVDRATLGRNELPLAILCSPHGTRPAERARKLAVSFSGPEGAQTDGVVVYRPESDVLPGARGDEMEFDYVVEASFNRVGWWTMQVEVDAPWAQENQAKTTMAILVEQLGTDAAKGP